MAGKTVSLNCCSGKHVSVSDHHNHFMALFPGPPRWGGARRELVEFMVPGKINRGRHADHPALRHSIPTNQWPPPTIPPFFTGRMPFLLPNQQRQRLTLMILKKSVAEVSVWVELGADDVTVYKEILTRASVTVLLSLYVVDECTSFTAITVHLCQLHTST